MVNREFLKDTISARGVSKAYLCDKLEINAQSLNNKLSGRSQFRDDEICALTKALHLSVDELMTIFFADAVDSSVNKEARA